MQIYTREDSQFYYYRFFINGKRYRGSTHRPITDRQGALNVLAEKRREVLEQQQLGVKPEITLENACQMTVDSVEGATHRSYDHSRRKILGGFKDCFGFDPVMNFSKLKQHNIDTLRKERQKEGLKENSINIELRFIKRMINLVGEDYKAPQDIRIKQLKGFVKTRVITDREIALIVSKLDKGLPAYDKALDMLYVYLDTGLRLEEALSLEWINVLFHRRAIEVYRSKTNSVSMLPMSDRVAAILERLTNQEKPFTSTHRAVKLLRAAIDDVCNGNPAIVKTRGKATIHSLRDTFATNLAQAGMSLEKIAALLGHKSIRTSQKYVHLQSADLMDETRDLLNRRA